MLFCFQNSNAQKKEFLLSGRVTDIETGEPIEDCNILFSGLLVNAQTDSAGYFVVSLKSNTYQLTARILGYKLKLMRLTISQNTEFNIALEKSEKLLDEVVISAEKADANVNRTIMGVERLSGKMLKKIPTLMGEADVIRSIMLLPGVSTVGEGASGFNVRGGNVDQNLVLLDGVPLFNTSHLFGFFTSFNADLVQDISLYKGGIPSMYGGKTSSVLDIHLKEGSLEKWSIQGGVGPIASRLTVDGPLIKNKTSIIIGARGSLSDFYLKYFPTLKNSKANFYDINGKITHKIGANQRLSLGFYTSQDAFKFSQDTLYYWNTQSINLKHNTLINKNLSHNFTAFYSNYAYGVEGLKPQFEYLWQPSIKQKSLKENLSYELPKEGRIDFGAEMNFYTLDGGSLRPNDANSIINNYQMQTENAKDFSIFASHSKSISKNISVDYGLRYVNYRLTGPGTFYSYQANTPRSISTIVDSVTINKNEILKTYGGFEPRLSIAFKIDSSLSLKLGYNKMQQFIHLLSNTMAISPADIWKSSNPQLPQQIANQYSLGIFKNWGNNSKSTYETSIEMYYKPLTNVIDYIDGAALYLNKNIETELLVGKGNAYGLEVFLKKARGVKLTGWVSYTYSRSFREILANENQLGANFGLKFPSNFDSPHNFKLVLNNRWTKRISFNSNISYNTGRPITYPNGRYKIYAYNDVYNYLVANGLNPRPGLDKKSYTYGSTIYTFLDYATIEELLDGYSATSFTLRNAERIPDYFRIDVGVNLDPAEGSKSNSTWNFSIYNLLSRNNVYSMYFKSITGNRNQARTYQLSVLGAAIPSLTYNFKF